MSSISGLIDRLGKPMIRQALRGGTAEKRANAVQKIGRDIRTIELTEPERAFAVKLMDRICEDVSALVRRALAITLRSSPNLPRHIAQTLIADIDSIAVPILSSSPVLTDNDLVDVLKSRAAYKIRAIAQRKKLSLHISHAIVSFGDSAATANLAANDGALISPETAGVIAELYADDDLIREASLARHDMPPTIISKLIESSASKIDASLRTYPGVSDRRAAQISRDTQERSQSYVIGQGWPENRLRDYARALDKSGKLTPRLILRSAGRGDMRFVVAALSVLGGQTIEKTRLMVMSTTGLGTKAMALRARFTVPQIDVLLACLQTYLAVERENRALTTIDFQRSVAERLLTMDIDLPDEVETDLLDLLDAYSLPRRVA